MTTETKSGRLLTKWSSPREIIDSGYGKIAYRVWCEKERDRINKCGDTVKIVEQFGHICLSR